MNEDEPIFLGAAILLSQKGRDPDDTEIRTAAENARKIREEVKRQIQKVGNKKPIAGTLRDALSMKPMNSKVIHIKGFCQ
jgi:hypothetical protein